jgi:hypothetical protein
MQYAMSTVPPSSPAPPLSLARARPQQNRQVRHSSVRTTDVAVEDVAELRDWLLLLMDTRLKPMLCACFPRYTPARGLGETTELHPSAIRRGCHLCVVST